MSRWLRTVPDRDEIAGEAFRCPKEVIKKFLKTDNTKKKDPYLQDGKKGATSLFKVKGRWSGKLEIGDM